MGSGTHLVAPGWNFHPKNWLRRGRDVIIPTIAWSTSLSLGDGDYPTNQIGQGKVTPGMTA